MNNKHIQQDAVFVRKPDLYTPPSINPTNVWKKPVLSIKRYMRELRNLKYFRHIDATILGLYDRAKVQENKQYVNKDNRIILTDNYK